MHIVQSFMVSFTILCIAQKLQNNFFLIEWNLYCFAFIRHYATLIVDINSANCAASAQLSALENIVTIGKKSKGRGINKIDTWLIYKVWITCKFAKINILIWDYVC